MATKTGRGSRAKGGAQARDAHDKNGDRPMHGPCTFVVFGGTGDLARRKILPALSRLRKQDLIIDDTNHLPRQRLSYLEVAPPFFSPSTFNLKP